MMFTCLCSEQVNAFFVTEIKIEGVAQKTGDNVTSTMPEQLVTDHNASIFNTEGLGVPAELLGGETPKKKRGRKSNFEKGLPFTIKGKAVSGTDIDLRVTPGEGICK
jgi:hypothetical protein